MVKINCPIQVLWVIFFCPSSAWETHMKTSCHRNFSLNRTEIQFHKPQRDSKYYLPMIFRYFFLLPMLESWKLFGVSWSQTSRHWTHNTHTEIYISICLKTWRISPTFKIFWYTFIFLVIGLFGVFWFYIFAW